MQVKQCMFCQKLAADGSFQLILKRALYSKYSQSQNFFYEKDINDILDEKQVKSTIRNKDNTQFGEEKEYMRRFYRFFESDDRIPSLLEYYKYHINIPRNFHSKQINKRMEKVREIQYCKVKIELGLYEDIKQQTPTKVKDSSDDCSVSQLKYLLKDLKLQSTDISRVSNTTVLKDLVQMIGETQTKPKPFQIFNQNKQIQKQFKPSQDAQRIIYQNCQGTLKKTIEMQLKQTKQINSPPLTQRIPKPVSTSRQSSAHKQQSSKLDIPIQTLKKPPQLKSRQASLGNIEFTKSCLNTARNTPQQNELLIELAKKMFSTKRNINNSNQKKKAFHLNQQQNFFVKGRTNLACSSKNFEDLKNSMRSLRSRHLTPSQICVSNHGSPKIKKK
ncbi:unnamed protein product [Paramecium sonneborni]|uniref:Uncharacterized protein n=1 Tax=Paramecium sonneborni TaxID=65129 RepID=A0A8S1QLT8_9CILI|nr:unnamed protein product [Paramecium sonneborni]